MIWTPLLAATNLAIGLLSAWQAGSLARLAMSSDGRTTEAGAAMSLTLMRLILLAFVAVALSLAAAAVWLVARASASRDGIDLGFAAAFTAWVGQTSSTRTATRVH